MLKNAGLSLIITDLTVISCVYKRLTVVLIWKIFGERNGEAESSLHTEILHPEECAYALKRAFFANVLHINTDLDGRVIMCEIEWGDEASDRAALCNVYCAEQRFTSFF